MEDIKTLPFGAVWDYYSKSDGIFATGLTTSCCMGGMFCPGGRGTEGTGIAILLDRSYIEALMLNERACANLYRAYAKHCFVHTRFWSDLAGEEDMHASILEVLDERVATGEVEVKAPEFRLTDVRDSTKFINKEITNIKRHGVEMKEALGFALEIEETMIEKEFFSVFLPQTTELIREFGTLTDHTDKHIEKIKRKKRGLIGTILGRE